MIQLLTNYIVKEHFTADAGNDDNENNENNETLYKLISIFSIICSFYAAYLSWTCNTVTNYPLGVKFVCALNAFFWGWIYLLYYYIVIRVDKSCSKFILTEVPKNQGSMGTSTTSQDSSDSQTSLAINNNHGKNGKHGNNETSPTSSEHYNFHPQTGEKIQ